MRNVPDTTIDRRDFLRVSTATGGGLLLGLYPTLPHGEPTFTGDSHESPDHTGRIADFRPSAFITIASTGLITLTVRNPEGGQGMKTMVPMLIAEELEVALADVVVQHAPADAKRYGRQFFGGSSGIPSNWEEMRQVGAVARELLITAAAQQWNVPASECEARSAQVHHRPSGRSLRYAQLADRAATLPVPELRTIRLKAPDQYRIIGKPVANVDGPAIVTGKPLFGIDVKLPGMQYAVFAKCPVRAGKVRTANIDEIRTMPGVRRAFVVEGQDELSGLLGGVAIVADRWWQARAAQQALRVEWNEGPTAQQSSANFVTRAAELAAGEWGAVLRRDGNVEQAFAEARRTVEARYEYPFLYHATMEPMNCTAHYRDGALEIWAPSQHPEGARQLVAQTLAMSEDRITIHQVRMGGAFGRRYFHDFVVEAAWIARETGVPVKLLWPREDDVQQGFYRPGGFHHLRGAVDAAGHVTAWQNHFVTFGDNGRPMFDAGLNGTEFPARFIPNFAAGMSMMPLGIPTGPLRAPFGNAMAFVMQSFIDELAHAADRDPLEFRRDLLAQPPIAAVPDYNVARIRTVLDLVAEKSGWATRKKEPGRGMGIAFHYSHRGYFAEVVDASVSANRAVKVHQVWVAGDVGRPIINPSGALGQVQGSVLEGLAQAMEQAITFDRGRVTQTGFRDYPALRLRNAPPVDVHFLKSANAPSGMGEPSLPPVIPALCNAIFAATGERVRTLPLAKSGFRWA